MIATDILKFFGTVGSRLFKGVYAADQIPYVDLAPAAFIVNTETSSTRGEHWLAVIQCNNTKIYFFDSFGRPPTSFNHYISDFVSRCQYDFNQFRFQDPKTQVCGYYCIFIILRAEEGCSENDVISELQGCKNSDEHVVNETYQEL
ncbi:hypothetical protein HNY73_006565 [Argiope bruennichi]|uniref:Ubiquitin-like protease family profile domain-containing protein n=1 Tax=Argiope bruennichi TaxID=94029 RepID=A0A8T0FB87_ARGBR|nr:hypothetical protein HNY73_006565 [Argiope bruennichi]